MILATDGIWDVMSPQDAVDLVRAVLVGSGDGDGDGDQSEGEQPPDLQAAAEELIRKCAPYSEDNMTVLVVALNQQAGPGGKALQAKVSSYGMVL